MAPSTRRRTQSAARPGRRSSWAIGDDDEEDTSVASARTVAYGVGRRVSFYDYDDNDDDDSSDDDDHDDDDDAESITSSLLAQFDNRERGHGTVSFGAYSHGRPIWREDMGSFDEYLN